MAIKRINLENDKGEKLREISPGSELAELDPKRLYDFYWHNEDHETMVVHEMPASDISEVQSYIAAIMKGRRFHESHVGKREDNYVIRIREAGHVEKEDEAA